jgi:hypothetical protein
MTIMFGRCPDDHFLRLVTMPWHNHAGADHVGMLLDGPRRREAASYITDYRNRCSTNPSYRTQYSIGNFVCSRHPQDNNPV